MRFSRLFLCEFVEMASRKSKTPKAARNSQSQDDSQSCNDSQNFQARFTPEEDEQIIDLVRSNDCLHKVADKQFKNNDYKHRLWSELAKKQNRDGESIQHIYFDSKQVVIIKKFRNYN